MKLLLYCTKAKPYITQGNDGSVYPSCVISDGIKEWHLNGKIVAECDFEVEKIENNVCGFGDYKLPYFETETLTGKEIEDKSCLSYEQLKGYLQNNGNGFYGYSGYAIHIKNLHIFDKPRDITKLVLINQYRNDLKGTQYNRVKVAPQNMCMVDYAIDCNYKENIFDSPYILISIQPEWLCKILNGEKTIEVRKKVLKEML